MTSVLMRRGNLDIDMCREQMREDTGRREPPLSHHGGAGAGPSRTDLSRALSQSCASPQL